MSIVDERSRHQMYLSLERCLGAEEADTLMNHLPPVGWADVAAKADLLALEDRIALRFDKVDLQFEAIDQRFAAIDQRFAGIDQRFAAIDQRFGEASAAVDRRFEDLDARLATFATKADLEAGLRSVTHTMVFAMVGTMMTLAALFLAVPR